MLIQNVELLSAGKLNLVCTAVGVGVLDLLPDSRNFSLRKGARVVLVESVAVSLSVVEYAVVGVKFFHRSLSSLS